MSTLTISVGTSSLELTGLVSEGNVTDSTVTSAPCEDGFDVASGKVDKPHALKIEALAQDFTHSKEGYVGRAAQILNQLRLWQSAASKVTVRTDGPSFIDYILTSVGYTRTSKASQLKLSLNLQEVKMVKTKWVAGKKVVVQKRSADTKGKTEDKVEPAKATTDSAPTRSLAHRLLGL